MILPAKSSSNLTIKKTSMPLLISNKKIHKRLQNTVGSPRRGPPREVVSRAGGLVSTHSVLTPSIINLFLIRVLMREKRVMLIRKRVVMREKGNVYKKNGGGLGTIGGLLILKPEGRKSSVSVALIPRPRWFFAQAVPCLDFDYNNFMK